MPQRRIRRKQSLGRRDVVMRERTEIAFERWGELVVRRPWLILLVSLAVVAAMGSRLPQITIDTTTEGFFHPDDPVLVAYDRFRERFGRDDFIVIGVESDDVFTAPFLERLRAFHDELERTVPYLDEVTSLLNARWTRGEEDQLVVEDFVERWPRDAGDLEELRRRALGNPIYVGSIISADARLTSVVIDLDSHVQSGTGADAAPEFRHLTGVEQRQVIDAIQVAMAAYDGEGFRTYASGTPWLTDRIAYRMTGDFPVLTRNALIMIATALLILFGRLYAIVLPLLVVVSAVVSTLGLAALLGFPYQLPTQIVPVALLSIGIGDSVHLLAIYYQRRRLGESSEEAVPRALGHAGPAILMTSLTTAGALLSFLTASLAPVANIGVLIPAGVMIAFALSITVLPALLILLPEREAPRPRRLAVLDRLVCAVGVGAARNPWPVLVVAGIGTAVAFVGIARLEVAHDPAVWFPRSGPLRIAIDHLNERLGALVGVEVIFETGETDGVKDPALLLALDRLTRENTVYRDANATYEHDGEQVEVGAASALSVVDLLKEVNRALNENDDEHYVVPGERELVAQELLLFELSGSNDLEDLVDYEYSTARMTLRLPWTDAGNYMAYLGGLLELNRERVGDAAQVSLTGRVPLLVRTMSAVIESMIRSYLLAFAAIVPLMILLLGRVRLGLIAMIPNLLPIAAVLGLMGWTGIPLDAFTLIVGSIALGLAVDDTIHFMHGFRRAFAQGGDPIEAVRETLATTGQALLFTTLILCGGFLVFTTGYLRNLHSFGILSSFALATAFVCDIVLAPALVVLAERRRCG